MVKLFQFWKTNKILNLVVFSNQIEKIQKEGLKKYLSSIFLLKNILAKLVLLAVFAALIFGLGFGLRDYYLYHDPSAIVLNKGIGFSHLSNQSSSVVYFVQSLPCVMALSVILFVPRWWVSFGFCMMLFGGLMNIIDRSMNGPIPPQYVGHVNSLVGYVVDYFNGGSSVFNIADVFVVMGTCFSALGLVVYCYILYKHEKATEKQRHAEGEYDFLDEIEDSDPLPNDHIKEGDNCESNSSNEPINS